VTSCLKNGLPLVQELRLRADIRRAGFRCRSRRGGGASKASFSRSTICRSARSPSLPVANALVISRVSLANLPIEQTFFRVREEDRQQGVGAFPDRLSKAVCLSHTGRKAERATLSHGKGWRVTVGTTSQNGMEVSWRWSRRALVIELGCEEGDKGWR